MKFLFNIVFAVLICSCNPDYNTADIEGAVTTDIKKVDLLEWLAMEMEDSLILVKTWKSFINDFDSIKEKSFEKVECWSSEDFQKVHYDTSDSISIDSCVIRYLIPLKRTEVWPMFESNNYNVWKLKYQSESVGSYCICFPRCETKQEIQNTFKHKFIFRKVGDRLLFQGYSFNP